MKFKIGDMVTGLDNEKNRRHDLYKQLVGRTFKIKEILLDKSKEEESLVYFECGFVAAFSERLKKVNITLENK